MTSAATTYDLMLILDPQAEESAREKIVADARAAIEQGGELTRHDDWGERALTYPIEKRSSGEYHLMQFHTGGAELLDGLDRSLRIADEVLRFRIIKLRPGTPEAPDMHATAAPRRAEAEAAGTSGAAPAETPDAAPVVPPEAVATETPDAVAETPDVEAATAPEPVQAQAPPASEAPAVPEGAGDDATPAGDDA
jgi:small subunit ribosomal protein S6